MRQARARRNRGFCRCGSSLRYEHCCKGRHLNRQDPNHQLSPLGTPRKRKRGPARPAPAAELYPDLALQTGLRGLLRGFLGLGRRGER